MLDRSEHHVSEVDGIRVVTERVPSVRSVSVGVWVGVGSRDERDHALGFAHLVEHLLFKGNERYGPEAISNFFDGIGSDANAATTKEYTVVHSRVLERHVPRTLEVFGNMVLAPAFDAGALDSERQVILEEIAMYNDSPSDVVHEVADELVFEGHPLGVPIVGTNETIEGATPDAVRAFHAGHYCNDELVISAAGDCRHEAFVEAVREHFLPAGAGSGRTTGAPALHSRLAAVPPPAHRARVVQKETEQTHICLAGQGVARNDRRRYAVAVLDTILGSTPSSRLFNEVRERRGLAYSVYSFTSHYSDTGQVGVYVAVRPDRVRPTLEVIRRELERVREQPPTAEELNRARDHLEGRMLLSLESTTVRGNRLGASLVTGMPIEPVDVSVERVHAVTAADVQELAQELFADERLAFSAVAEDAAAVRDTAADVLGLDGAAVDVREAVA